MTLSFRSPTVSVVIPAYKASGIIGRALDSLLAQTRPPDEILVVDDGSPDDLAAAVAAYGDRVRVLRQPNGGAASARNHGIEQSKGELIAFLDADDYWEPHKLALQLEILERHPEVGLCGGCFFTEWPGTGKREVTHPGDARFQNRVLRLDGIEAFLAAKQIWTSMVMVRRTALGSQRFDQGLKTAEDIDLWIRLILAGPIYLLSEPLATLVMMPGSLSRSDVASDYGNMLQVVRRHARLLGPAALRAREANVFRDWAAGHLAEGERRKALWPAWNRLLREPWSPQAWWILFKSAVWSCTPWGSRRQQPGHARRTSSENRPAPLVPCA